MEQEINIPPAPYSSDVKLYKPVVQVFNPAFELIRKAPLYETFVQSVVLENQHSME